MVTISIRGNMESARKHLSALQRKQIPFATSLAMNETIVAIQREEKRRMVRDLDRPTATTVNAIRIFKSNKRRLKAGVFILPAVAEFLRYQIEGGTRRPRGRVEAIPRDIKLNRFGNIPARRAGKLRRLLQKPGYFQGVVGGISGIWQRTKDDGLRLLVEYSKARGIRYSRRYPFYRIAEYTAGRVYDGNFRKAIQRATR